MLGDLRCWGEARMGVIGVMGGERVVASGKGSGCYTRQSGLQPRRATSTKLASYHNLARYLAMTS